MYFWHHVVVAAGLSLRLGYVPQRSEGVCLELQCYASHAYDQRFRPFLCAFTPQFSKYS